MMMAKAKIVHRDLPPRMTLRTGKNKRGEVWTAYYYEHPRDPVTKKRPLTPLGKDLTEAKKQWAELEIKPIPQDAQLLGHIFTRYEREETPKKSPRTQIDEANYFKRLHAVFGKVNINAVTPQHIRQYLDKRSAKVQGNREMSLFSTVFNKAREWGYTSKTNPCQGVKKNRETGRDIYVSDADLALVYKHASPVVQDMLDLAYLTGQRPADVLGLQWSQVRDGALWISQGKTSAKLRIELIGELATVIERIRSRHTVGMTILTTPDGQRLKLRGYLRSHFDKARDAAEAEAKELEIEFQRFQLRDLRAKAASDMESIGQACKLLGHTTENMTRQYVRHRVGESVNPVMRKKIGK